MLASRIWMFGVVASFALAGCGKPSTSADAAAKAGNDPAEAGAQEIEAKANETVKAKIADLENYSGKAASAAASAADKKSQKSDANISDKKK